MPFFNSFPFKFLGVSSDKQDSTITEKAPERFHHLFSSVTPSPLPTPPGSVASLGSAFVPAYEYTGAPKPLDFNTVFDHKTGKLHPHYERWRKSKALLPFITQKEGSSRYGFDKTAVKDLGRRFVECPVPDCGFIGDLSKPSALPKHLDKVHPRESCPFCKDSGFGYMGPRQKYEHLMEKHPDIRANSLRSITKNIIRKAIPERNLEALGGSFPVQLPGASDTESSRRTEAVSEAFSRSTAALNDEAGPAVDRSLSQTQAPHVAHVDEIMYQFCDRCSRNHRILCQDDDRNHHDLVCRPGVQGGFKWCDKCGQAGIPDQNATPASVFPHDCPGISENSIVCIDCGLAMDRDKTNKIRLHIQECCGYSGSSVRFCPYCNTEFASGWTIQIRCGHIAVCDYRPTVGPATTPYDLYPEQLIPSRKRRSPHDGGEDGQDQDSNVDVDSAGPPIMLRGTESLPKRKGVLQIARGKKNAEENGATGNGGSNGINNGSKEVKVKTVVKKKAVNTKAQKTPVTNRARGLPTPRNTASITPSKTPKAIRRRLLGKASISISPTAGRDIPTFKGLDSANEIDLSQRGQSPKWLDGEDDKDIFTPTENMYCSRCLRRAPTKPTRKPGDPTAAEQLAAHEDPELGCGIPRRLGSPDIDGIGLPNHSGWIDFSKQYNGKKLTISSVREKFLKDYPLYKHTMYPADGSNNRHAVWANDPNHGKWKENWNLPWPPYKGRGPIPASIATQDSYMGPEDIIEYEDDADSAGKDTEEDSDYEASLGEVEDIDEADEHLSIVSDFSEKADRGSDTTSVSGSPPAFESPSFRVASHISNQGVSKNKGKGKNRARDQTYRPTSDESDSDGEDVDNVVKT
ncbi:hypothetical protein CFIMG_003429RA [Ceratocystis fimbriata CBS 114723]|uniref:Uncharacterized protein n=1 Tax=Ceratocystis fimbriata CBS 114723 TaxID=1035309 RepID=A0A2C5XAI6_9PEZI|nr:hypothetical protein CFIMG_003429RA [Ceratocystis fimbriata CBS 114723]